MHFKNEKSELVCYSTTEKKVLTIDYKFIR